MEELQLSKPSQVKIIYDGAEYVINKPNAGDQRAMRHALKGVEKDDVDGQEKCLIDFLVKQGIPKKVLDSLDYESLGQIVETLSGKKKT